MCTYKHLLEKSRPHTNIQYFEYTATWFIDHERRLIFQVKVERMWTIDKIFSISQSSEQKRKINYYSYSYCHTFDKLININCSQKSSMIRLGQVWIIYMKMKEKTKQHHWNWFFVFYSISFLQTYFFHFSCYIFLLLL